MIWKKDVYINYLLVDSPTEKNSIYLHAKDF